ncbi:MAG: acyltransferase [Maricaulis sp.]|nr:acyltransferase [Maricaulis sp.]MDG2043335.1 acyltransferase [Maricaulis sp.]
MTAAKQPIIPQIQYLRGFAVILVVIAHLHQSNARFFDVPLLGDFAYFGFGGVDVFFVISGYIIHRLYGGLQGLNFQFILQRANRIFPLYWVFTAAAVIGYFTIGDAFTRDAGELDIVGSLSLIPTGQAPILMVGWTLTHELYFYAAYAVWLAVPRKAQPWAAAGWGLLTLLSAVAFPIAASPWLALALSPFNLLFLGGALLAHLDDRFRNQRWVALALAGAGALYGMMSLNGSGLGGLENPAARVVLLAPFAFGFVAAVLAWKPVFPTLLAQIGDWSYAIYLSHILLIGLLARVAPSVLGGSLWSGLVFFLIGLAGCIVLGFASNKLLERPLLRAGKAGIRKLFSADKRE